jgi:hypothetical protein
MSNILVPTPGTKLYDRLKEELNVRFDSLPLAAAVPGDASAAWFSIVRSIL